MKMKKKPKFENPYLPFNKIKHDLTMKKEISKKYLFTPFLLIFVSVFGTNPPPIRDAPPPPGFPIDGNSLLAFVVIAVLFGIYKLKLNTTKK